MQLHKKCYKCKQDTRGAPTLTKAIRKLKGDDQTVPLYAALATDPLQESQTSSSLCFTSVMPSLVKARLSRDGMMVFGIK